MKDILFWGGIWVAISLGLCALYMGLFWLGQWWQDRKYAKRLQERIRQIDREMEGR